VVTYAQSQAKGNARAVFWMEISGIPYVFSDGLATAAKFGTDYEADLTFKNLLMEPEFSFARSIEILTGKGQTSGFEIKLLDAKGGSEPDGFLTWLLFGKNRSSIARTRLTADVEKHIGGAGHNWAVEDNSDFAESGYAYCGLETISYASTTGTTEFTTVGRSQYKSPATCHKTAKGQTLYPYVTDHPIEWEGRIVTLFQSYMDANGTLAVSTAGSYREAAHKVRGIISGIAYESGVWTITCKGIETVLDKPLLNNTARSRVILSRILVTEGNETVCAIAQTTAAHEALEYRVSLDTGEYDLETFFIELNTAIAAGLEDQHGNTNFRGQLSLTLEDNKLSFRFIQDPIEEDNLVDARFKFGTEQHGRDYWANLGIYSESFNLTPGDPPVNIAVGSEHITEIERRLPSFDLNMASFEPLRDRPRVALSDDLDSDPISSYAVGDYVGITSNAGTSFCKILGIGEFGEFIILERATNYTELANECVHTSTFDSPIWISKIAFALDGQVNVGSKFADPLLQLLLSTGLAGFNHEDYDTFAEGVGIEVPHWSLNAGSDSGSDSLINITAFEEFFRDVEPWINKIFDVFAEPRNAMEYVCQRLAFFGGYLIVENGQLSCRRGLFTMPHQETAAITTNGLLFGNQTIQMGGIQTVKGIQWSVNYDPSFKAFATKYVVTLADSKNVDSYIELEDRGIRTTPEQMIALGAEILSDFAGVPVVYTVSLDRSFADLEPGSVVSFTDDGKIPNPNGTLGHSATRMLVLSAETNFQQATSTVKLLQSFNNRSGYSASGWIESFTGSTVTLATNFFSKASDGVDASRFGVGDKVRIQRVSPTQAGTEPDANTAQIGLTVVSISGDDIVLDTPIATYSGDWVSEETALVLTHDPYQTTGQTAKARAWGWVGDSSGDIGDVEGSVVYQW